jgi:DNA-directed RNA polymerase specialized sigma24 family protein
MSSLTGNASAAGGQPHAAAFATTHWTLVLEAQGESPAAHEALEKLCRIYWRPVYSFVRQNGIQEHEAEDLTQGFFALLLERRDFSAVRREKGRLRSYLLAALKHHTTDDRRLPGLLGLLLSTLPISVQASEKIEKIRPGREPAVITIRNGAD